MNKCGMCEWMGENTLEPHRCMQCGTLGSMLRVDKEFIYIDTINRLLRENQVLRMATYGRPRHQRRKSI